MFYTVKKKYKKIRLLRGFFMNWLTDEMLFYGGIAVAAGSLVVMALYFCVTQIKKVRLDIRLNAEYGEKDL